MKDSERQRPTLSRYKWKRLAIDSLANALRLHADSLLLFRAGSFPSSFQLSVLALEEFSKAKWVEHYYYSSITNCGFPGVDFEQEWLQLLYMHREKQYAFIARDVFYYPPQLVEFIKGGSLERRKQAAVYVGLESSRRSVDVDRRISRPTSIKKNEAKQMISWVNSEFALIYGRLLNGDSYFEISGMDDVLIAGAETILSWPHKSRLRLTKPQFEERSKARANR